MPPYILMPSSAPLPERKHLQRLERIWIKHPVYFLTLCTISRRRILANATVAELLVTSWSEAASIHGWLVGRYVIMPDHVHFFVADQTAAKSLSEFLRDWKRWTTRQVAQTTSIEPPIWQGEFFDHVLRSARSYAEKWEYVRQNPVRAGLVARAEDWLYSGECHDIL
jgi:REP element-mobilizing transposase RayT